MLLFSKEEDLSDSLSSKLFGCRCSKKWTTVLSGILLGHPAIQFEVHFFDVDTKWDKGINSYRLGFPVLNVFMEANLRFPLMAKLLRFMLPRENLLDE